MIVCETKRLRLRHFSNDDAEFIIELLNDPSFINNITDKGVRNRDDAIRYMQEGPMLSYQTFGFGLNLVEFKEMDEKIGVCGLLKRDVLDDPDLGYAFLPQYWGKGYAAESVIK